MTALTKEQFEDVQRRIGGLGLTEADRKALLREVRLAIKDQQKILKDKDDLSESVWRALEAEVDDIASKISEPLATKVTDIIQARIPLDLTGPFEVPKNIGAVATRIDEKANEILTDVVKFHRAYSAGESDEAETALTDILDTGEADALRADFGDLASQFSSLERFSLVSPEARSARQLFGDSDSEVETLRTQVTALINMAKVFEKQYAVLNGKDTMDAVFIAYDLAKAYKEQDEKVKEAVRAKRNLDDALNINLSGTEMDPQILADYEEKIKSLYMPVTASIIETAFLEPETGLTPKSVKNIDFDAMAKEITEEACATIKIDAPDYATIVVQKAEDIARQRAKKTFRSFRARGLTAGGKVVDRLVDNAKAAGGLAVGGLTATGGMLKRDFGALFRKRGANQQGQGQPTPETVDDTPNDTTPNTLTPEETEAAMEASDAADEALGIVRGNPSVLTNVPFDAAEQIPDRMRAARENLKQRFDEWCEKYIDNKLQQQILTNSPPPPLDKPPADQYGDNRRYYAFNQEAGTWYEANLWSDGDELLPGRRLGYQYNVGIDRDSEAGEELRSMAWDAESIIGQRGVFAVFNNHLASSYPPAFDAYLAGGSYPYKYEFGDPRDPSQRFDKAPYNFVFRYFVDDIQKILAKRNPKVKKNPTGVRWYA